MRHYFFTCSADRGHVVKSLKIDGVNGKACMRMGCSGTYAVVNKIDQATKKPIPWQRSGASITVKYPDGKREVVDAIDYTDRRARATTRSKTARDAIKAKLRGTPAPVSGPAPVAGPGSASGSGSGSGKDEEDGNVAMPAADGDPYAVSDAEMVGEDEDDDGDDDPDDRDFIAGGEKYTGPKGRCSIGGAYVPRGDLDQVIAKIPLHQCKHQAIQIGAKVHRGKGQKAQCESKDAPSVSKRKLPPTKTRRKDGSAMVRVSEEWNHLNAASLGGSTSVRNLVAASFSCNTYMAVIEASLRGRNDCKIDVTAYCRNGPDLLVAEAVRYKILKRNKLVYTALIDATVQHFGEADYFRVKRAVDSAIGKYGS